MTDQPAPAEAHPYNRACRNTQHSGCTCLYPVDGTWCGRPRSDPVHADQPAPAQAPMSGESPTIADITVRQFFGGSLAQQEIGLRTILEAMDATLIEWRQFQTERDDANARADGLLLVVEELRTALAGMLESYDMLVGRFSPMPDLAKDVVAGAFLTEPSRARAILAAEPEVRGAELMKAREGD